MLRVCTSNNALVIMVVIGLTGAIHTKGIEGGFQTENIIIGRFGCVCRPNKRKLENINDHNL